MSLKVTKLLEALNFIQFGINFFATIILKFTIFYISTVFYIQRILRILHISCERILQLCINDKNTFVSFFLTFGKNIELFLQHSH